jgi:hypothetical protein
MIPCQPTLIDARVYMANMLTDTGRVEEAVPLLREALEQIRITLKFIGSWAMPTGLEECCRNPFPRVSRPGNWILW